MHLEVFGLLLILLFANTATAATISEKQFSDSTATQAPTIPYCAEVPSTRLRTQTDYVRHFGRDRDDKYRKDEGKRTIAIVLMVVGGLAVLLALVCFGVAIIAAGSIMATIYTLFGVVCTVVGLLIGVPGIYMYNRYHKKLKRARRAEVGLR